jgi:hypothetical protein
MLGQESAIHVNYSGKVIEENRADRRRPVEAKADSTSDAAFASTVRPNDHVQVRAQRKFHVIVGNKIVQFDSDNRAGDEPDSTQTKQ